MIRIRRQAGFIVLIVMIVIVMITLAGSSFVLNLSTENKAVHLQGDLLQLNQTLASAVELLRGYLDQPAVERQQAGGLWDNPDVFGSIAVTSAEDASGFTQFSVLSPRVEGDVLVGLRCGLQNESARLNLAVLPEWELAEPGAASRALMQLPGMTEAAADAILDWIDSDETVRASGAETDYYAQAGLPYQPRNGVPAALEELLLIRDVGRLSLFGADTNVDYRVDEQEAQRAGESSGSASAGSATAGQTPWAWLLTVHSAERNRSAEGAARIYLNDADLSRLHARLSEAFDPAAADFVITYRQFGPAETDVPPAAASPPRSAVGSRTTPRRARREAEQPSVDLSRPAEHEIESLLDLIGARVELPPEEPAAETSSSRRSRVGSRRRALGGPIAEPFAEDELPESELPESELPEGEVPEEAVVLESPLEDLPQQLAEQLPQWLDLTSTSSQTLIRGRVNIDEATRPVLLAVPGMEPAVAEQILAARSGPGGEEDIARRHPEWLLLEGLVDREQMRRLAPYLTCGGDVFRAQVVASDAQAALAVRAEIVLDATVSPPRQVYWKDLGMFGGGFTAADLATDSAGSPLASEPGF